VGDATIGEQSNIGAGTIFANYDGVTKNSTNIGSHVRSGSHNVFVAPVSIGDGAYTGAGAVIRKDVPAGSMALSVAPQRNMDGWVEKNRPGTPAADAAKDSRDK
jgi:bifunctional UDP-N-acetylglucosamine pyrophosphorylase/glucosamine-1-phosphate N-acetyltransferase